MKYSSAKKILLFTTRFAPHVGGVENVVENITKYSEYDVSVLTSIDFFENHLQKLFACKKDRWRSKNDIYRIWMNMPRSVMGAVAFPYRFITSLVAIFLLMQKNRFKVVNYHYPDDSLIYFLFTYFLFRFNYIVNIHGNDIQINSDKKFYKPLFKILFHHATYIVANSNYMKSQIIDRYLNISSKIKIIPNGIDSTHFKNIKEILPEKDKYIFAIGRIVEKKGFDVLLKAFAVSKARENLVLYIEGTGENLEKIKSLAKSLKLGERVKFFEGSLDHVQKVTYMKNALIGVIPSRIEPFGIVALEFMASGTPLIGSRTGGLVDLIDGKNTGILFNVDDVNDLATKIDELVSNSHMRNTLSYGEFNFVKEFDMQKIVERYDSLYKKLFEL